MYAIIRRILWCAIALLSVMLLTGGLHVDQRYDFETKTFRFEEVECLVSLEVSRRLLQIPLVIHYESQELPANIHLAFVDKSRTFSSVEVSEIIVELENGRKQKYSFNWAKPLENDFALLDRDRSRTGNGIVDVSIQQFGRYIISIKGSLFKDMGKKVFSESFHMDISSRSSQMRIYPFWLAKVMGPYKT